MLEGAALEERHVWPDGSRLLVLGRGSSRAIPLDELAPRLRAAVEEGRFTGWVRPEIRPEDYPSSVRPASADPRVAALAVAAGVLVKRIRDAGGAVVEGPQRDAVLAVERALEELDRRPALSAELVDRLDDELEEDWTGIPAVDLSPAQRARFEAAAERGLAVNRARAEGRDPVEPEGRPSEEEGRLEGSPSVPFDDLPRLSPAELRESGILQELNRRLLHPRGLAMFVSMDDDGELREIGIVRDEDPEGWTFRGPEYEEGAAERAAEFAGLLLEGRRSALGYVIQPIPGTETVEDEELEAAWEAGFHRGRAYERVIPGEAGR